MNNLKKIASQIHEELKTIRFNKRVLAVGEVMILFNDFLNNFTFSNLKDQEHRVVYSPLSEAMWMLWKAFAQFTGRTGSCDNAVWFSKLSYVDLGYNYMIQFNVKY